MIATKLDQLAVLGGAKTVASDPGDTFQWPIVTRGDEEAVLGVLRRGAMSGSDVTTQFETEFAEWHRVKHALAYCNGTASILGAMFGCGIGVGDEVIGPSLTYWATMMPMLSLGAVPVFADTDEHSLCVDPDDIEHRITERTRAIIVTHLFGHPCEMDAIMRIADKHGLKVIEDVSHAQGGFYRGRVLGTIGHVGAMSLMSGKSLAVGEGGMIVTDDDSIFQRAVAFGYYERTGGGSNYANGPCEVTDPELARFGGLPLGGYKHRMNQTCSAMGRVQLKYYPLRAAEIRAAIDCFWDLLDGVPGIRPHRVAPGSGSNMAGWYCPVGFYEPEELGGLPLDRFIDAVTAEGAFAARIPENLVLHLHPVMQTADVYKHGRPTVTANASRDVSHAPGSLPRTERAPARLLRIPYFKRCNRAVIEEHAAAYRKAIEQCDRLVEPVLQQAS